MSKRERLFRFKQFAVSHEVAAMKVGTDGVTIGAWAPCHGRVLDVGCGCGLIGLMAAQRGASEVVMLEIDPATAAEAAGNAARSPWSDRIEVNCCDFLNFAPTRPFDCIISNPPFFANGLEAPDSRRASARHEGRLTARAFMTKAAGLAECISVILPPDRVEKWQSEALMAGLHTAAICRLLTTSQSAPRRIMLTFCKISTNTVLTDLMINSDEYRALTNPFYL